MELQSKVGRFRRKNGLEEGESGNLNNAKWKQEINDVGGFKLKWNRGKRQYNLLF